MANTRNKVAIVFDGVVCLETPWRDGEGGISWLRKIVKQVNLNFWKIKILNINGIQFPLIKQGKEQILIMRWENNKTQEDEYEKNFSLCIGRSSSGFDFYFWYSIILRQYLIKYVLYNRRARINFRNNDSGNGGQQ
ncbi:MAG: hypothetical protein FWH14_04490 [Oscillospiraceae bacterium]|nr:hypothetical protein [Oscillospiraceae bacterium]